MAMRAIYVRLSDDLYQLVDKVCKALEVSKADFTRMAIKEKLARMAYLSPEEKKALGVES